MKTILFVLCRFFLFDVNRKQVRDYTFDPVRNHKCTDGCLHQLLCQVSLKRVHDELISNKIADQDQFVERVQTIFINCLLFNECPTVNETIRKHSFTLLDLLEKIYRPFHAVLERRDKEFSSEPLMDAKSRSYCRLVMEEVICYNLINNHQVKTYQHTLIELANQSYVQLMKDVMTLPPDMWKVFLETSFDRTEAKRMFSEVLITDCF